MRPHRWQPTRLPRPWDSPGKNTGVGCHLLLQCMQVKSEREVAQSCPTPSDPMDCSPPGSSAHGICQARVLEWGAIALIIIILIQCPASENPVPLPVKLKCLCSEPCPPRDGRKKEINTSPSLRLAILGDTCKIKWPLYFVSPPSPICDP